MPSTQPKTPTANPNLLLAMDTSGDVCSIALVRGGSLMEEHAFRHEMHLSERLISLVDGLLKGAGNSLDDVDCFAVGIGPGSFTGTRIGVMTMKTFALVRHRPIIGVNGLETMAAEYGGLPETLVVPILACRSGFVYSCPYLVEQFDPQPLAEPAAFMFEELGALLQTQTARTILFCGPAAGRYSEELRFSTEGCGKQVTFSRVEFPRASTLARLALARMTAGIAPPPALELVPLYISPPPITLPKRPIPQPTRHEDEGVRG